MPFNLFRRGEQPSPAAQPPSPAPQPPAGTPGGIAFEAYTEDWHLVGRITTPGRLSDILNRREPISIAGVRWAPLDGSAPFSEAPGLEQVDPYDLLAVLTGPDSLPELDAQRRAALRVHKVTYDVMLDLGILRVFGTVYMYPGSEPAQLMDRHTELFVPVTGAAAFHDDRRLSGEVQNVVLVNRSYLRKVEPVERGDGGAFVPAPAVLPGRAEGAVAVDAAQQAADEDAAQQAAGENAPPAAGEAGAG